MSKLATEEMMPCPTCGELTFNTGDCFHCRAIAQSKTASNECERCLREERVKEYEQLVVEAMIGAKEMQDFLWDRHSSLHKPFDLEIWVPIFQKRVDRISEIDPRYEHYTVELRKRLLQQAALSLQAILALNGPKTPAAGAAACKSPHVSKGDTHNQPKTMTATA